MPRKNLPPYVQRVERDGRPTRYRGWSMTAGKRRFGPLRDKADKAHADAMKMRGSDDAPDWSGTFGTRTKDWLLAIAGKSAADTIEYYRSCIRRVQKSTIAATLPVDRITPDVLRQFVRDAVAEGLSPRTIQHCRRALNTFFVWLLRRGYLNSNPVPAVEWPRVEDTAPDVLNELELADCLQRITDPWAADLALFVACTGLRRAEVARLESSDVDVVNGVLWVRGKARSQSHPIPAQAIEAARRLLRPGFLIPGATDKARRSKIAETFRHWQKKLAEPRWHPHTLRHSVATIMLRKGVQPAVVQRFLRHKTYVMTQRYVHMVESDVRDAAAVLSFHGSALPPAK